MGKEGQLSPATHSLGEVEDWGLNLGLLLGCGGGIVCLLVGDAGILAHEGPDFVDVDGGHVEVARTHVVVAHTNLDEGEGLGHRFIVSYVPCICKALHDLLTAFIYDDLS